MDQHCCVVIVIEVYYHGISNFKLLINNAKPQTVRFKFAQFNTIFIMSVCITFICGGVFLGTKYIVQFISINKPQKPVIS